MRIAAFVAWSLVLLAGCSTSNQRQQHFTATGTVIASIGHGGLITFEPPSGQSPSNDLETGVIIPIRLAYLNTPKPDNEDPAQVEKDEVRLTEVGVLLTGTCPPNEKDYYIRCRGETGTTPRTTIAISPANAGSNGKSEETLELVLTKNYIRRVKSRDNLRVQVDVRDIVAPKRNVTFAPSSQDADKPSTRVELNMSSGNGGNPFKAAGAKTAIRTFSLFEAESYRNERLKKNLPLYDIHAFPLSPDQCEYLFGTKINQNFYVLAISFQNSDGSPRLITTGMIRISGLAMVNVNTNAESDGSHNGFMIPVTIQPTSREHVYAILDDEEVESPRSVIFRGLKLAGTIGTAVVQGFGAAEAVERGFAIFTGVGIPEGEKFWADRWPGYKRNVVNFAMPNLVRVDSGSNTPAMFLFVSKRELQALVLDADLFKQIDGTNAQIADLRDGHVIKRSPRRPMEAAPTFVANISVDSIEVPFFTNAAGFPADDADVRAKLDIARQKIEIDQAIAAVKKTSEELATLTKSATTAGTKNGVAVPAALSDPQSTIATLISALPGFITAQSERESVERKANKTENVESIVESIKDARKLAESLSSLQAFSASVHHPTRTLASMNLAEAKAHLEVEKSYISEVEKSGDARQRAYRDQVTPTNSTSSTTTDPQK